MSQFLDDQGVYIIIKKERNEKKNAVNDLAPYINQVCSRRLTEIYFSNLPVDHRKLKRCPKHKE